MCADLASDLEIIRVIRHLFDTKYELTTYLQQIGISVPETSSYNQILGLIRASGNEEKFAHAVFHTKDLESGIEAEDLLQRLSTLTLLELRDLGQELSNHEKDWRFRKLPKAALLRDLTRHCGSFEVNQAIQKLVRTGDIGFYQSGKWVVGPLGMTKSVDDRNTSDISILDFLDEHFSQYVSQRFVARYVTSDSTTKRVNDLSVDELHQVILTNFTDAQFIEYTNELLNDGTLKLQSYADYEDFLATPVGLFVRDYSEDPLYALADILNKYLGEEDVKHEFRLSRDGIKEALLEKLLVESSDPRKILADHFGIRELKRIAKDFGLVAMNDVDDKSKLIEYLMFRIGFRIPRAPRGIGQRLEAIEMAIRELKTKDLVTQKGIATSAFVDLESVIKDVICFYATALWEDEIDEVKSTEEVTRIEAIDIYLSKRLNFGGSKPLHKLTLGQLKGVLFALDEHVHSGVEARPIFSMLSRDTILTPTERNQLDSVSRLRPRFTHDVPPRIESEDCLRVVCIIRDMFRSFLEGGTYPTPITLTKSVTNEFGVDYFEGIDEFNTRCIIKMKGSWMDPGVYLMKKGTPPVAIDPIIVDKFWSET